MNGWMNEGGQGRWERNVLVSKVTRVEKKPIEKF